MAPDHQDDDDEEEPPPFRWLAAARFAAACVMTALVVVVMLNADTVVRRRRVETLSLSLVQGAIFTRRSTAEKEKPATQVLLDFNLRASNPSNRVHMYYFNVTAYLFGAGAAPAASNPEHGSFIQFDMDMLELQQGQSVESFVQVKGTRGETMEKSSFDMLERETISDVTMRLDGELVVELLSGINRTSSFISHYCWPLVVGVDPGNVREFLSLNLKDVFCRQVQGRHFII